MAKESLREFKKKCTVISCSNSEDNNSLNFFTFPTNHKYRQIWKEKCGISADHDVKNMKICSDHFRSDDYNNRNLLKASAIPKENLGWMFGMPAVDLHYKTLTEENEMLKQQYLLLHEEAKIISKKEKLLQQQIDKIEMEIYQTKRLKFKNFSKNIVNNNAISKIFSQAQFDLLLGRKKVVWSNDDLAKAFTLRIMGNKDSYLYLKNTLNFPLPSLSCVQRWMASNS